MTGKKENLWRSIGNFILSAPVSFKKYNSTFENVTRFSKTFYTCVSNLTQKHVFLRKNATLRFLQLTERFADTNHHT